MGARVQNSSMYCTVDPLLSVYNKLGYYEHLAVTSNLFWHPHWKKGQVHPPPPPPRTRYTPRAGTPPDQVLPPGRYTPPGRSPPPGRYTPGPGTPSRTRYTLHPPDRYKQAVRILLEYILVFQYFQYTFTNSSQPPPPPNRLVPTLIFFSR